MSQPEITLATYIGSQVGALTYGTNLFPGPMRPSGEGSIPHECVFVISTGGLAPQQFVGMSTSIKYHGAQVMIRGDRKDFQGGLALARSCYDAAHKAPLSGYIDCLVVESDPSYLGEDDDGHPLWSINLILHIRE